MADAKHEPTALAKIVIFLFIAGCIAGALFLWKDKIFPPQGGPPPAGGPPAGGGAGGAPAATAKEIEAPDDTKGITTAKEYKYVPQDKLPPVKGVSSYKWDDAQKLVKFPINVWIGWLPIVAANHGFAPNAESIFSKNYGFKVDLKLIDDPVVARDAFATGDSHVLWGTLDMMVLFAPELSRDSRTAPRIYQQVDWSNGGDGIVVRGNIKSARDLRGKTVVYAQNSPSQYFFLNLLISAGIPPNQVKSKFVPTAFEAAAAFVSDKSIDGCVSWAPDIYKIPEKVPNTRILTTTSEANKVIADVWAVRADFAKDHPEVVKGLVAGIFDGMRLLKDEKFRAQACKWMADGYQLGVEEIQGMLHDAHSTNFAENKEFFLNANNPTNFERTWKNIGNVYREVGVLSGSPIRFDEVMDFTVLQTLDKEGLFKDDRDEYASSFAPTSYQKVKAESPILTQTIRINFYPNSANIYEPQHDDTGQPVANTLYDPNVNATLEKVARLAGQYDRAVIQIAGHTDSSLKGRVPYDAVKKLSLDRANAVKKAIIDTYKFDPNKFGVEGKAWDAPFDEHEPLNQAMNRRVEISVLPPEAQ
jgi:ABC-type nitrate/sulfonate/bicarbonate transport system substrate-binding protein